MYWNIKTISAQELVGRLQQQPDSLRVIDVREHREIIAGAVPGAEAMPLATIPLRLGELDREDTLVFVCRSGARSAQACAYLQQQGYDKVYNLQGGMIAWAREGLPAPLPEAI
jgi:rhodanese-related sulfurtransferase